MKAIKVVKRWHRQKAVHILLPEHSSMHNGHNGVVLLCFAVKVWTKQWRSTTCRRSHCWGRYQSRLAFRYCCYRSCYVSLMCSVRLVLTRLSFVLPLQILIKEYNFDSRHKPAFTEEDILNIFPVVKHVNPKASDAFHFFQSGQAKVQQGTLKHITNEPPQTMVLLCWLMSLFLRLPKGGLWAHQRGFEPLQQCVWSHACGDLCLPAPSGPTQLHHGWSPWGTSHKLSPFKCLNTNGTKWIILGRFHTYRPFVLFQNRNLICYNLAFSSRFCNLSKRAKLCSRKSHVSNCE